MAIIASIPILVVIVLMIAFGKPAKIALPIGWVIALAIALFYWRQDTITAFAWALDGFLEAIGTMVIILGAILIMNTLKHSGAVTAIQRRLLLVMFSLWKNGAEWRPAGARPCRNYNL